MIKQEKQFGGKPIQVRDCYVWAEIYYLDSPTDYREYLPEYSYWASTLGEADLVLLDDSGTDRRTLTAATTRAATLVVLSCALLSLVIYLCI
jgi:hypothetical protein